MSYAFGRFHKEDLLTSYVSSINDFPILDHDEEYDLAMQWKETGNKKALDKLVRSHIRLVMKIASGYSGYGMSYSDLVAEGNVGIMHALQHFNPSSGYRFSTYASYWIKSKINNFVYNFWSVVRMSNNKANRKLFFNLRKIKNKLGIENISDEDAETISKKLEVKEKDVMTFEKRFKSKDFSANSPLKEDGAMTLQDFLSDNKPTPEDLILDKQEHEYRKKVLHEALQSLSKREYDILVAYRLREPPKTLKDISVKLNISSERVRQIENAAFLKIQKFVKSVKWNAANRQSNYSNVNIVLF